MAALFSLILTKLWLLMYNTLISIILHQSSSSMGLSLGIVPFFVPMEGVLTNTQNKEGGTTTCRKETKNSCRDKFRYLII